jgi:hypothetical protein
MCRSRPVCRLYRLLCRAGRRSWVQGQVRAAGEVREEGVGRVEAGREAGDKGTCRRRLRLRYAVRRARLRGVQSLLTRRGIISHRVRMVRRLEQGRRCGAPYMGMRTHTPISRLLPLHRRRQRKQRRIGRVPDMGRLEETGTIMRVKRRRRARRDYWRGRGRRWMLVVLGGDREYLHASLVGSL